MFFSNIHNHLHGCIISLRIPIKKGVELNMLLIFIFFKNSQPLTLYIPHKFEKYYISIIKKDILKLV